MTEAVIVSAVRTPTGKAKRGQLRNTRPDELAAIAIREAVARAPGVDPADVEDVFLGCAMPEGEQGMNLARIATLRAGLPVTTSAVTVNRFCSSGLQTIAMAADAIRSGRLEVAVAGGAESMSRVGMMARSHANPEFAENWPDVYLAMGLTAENVAKKYGVAREDADQFALESHQKALAAIEGGRFAEQIVSVPVEDRRPGENGSVEVRASEASVDEGPRPDTSIEGLSKLRPVFAARGTVTAGTSSQMSDGAAALTLMSDARAESLGLEPRAIFRAFAVGGVPPEIMGIGPVEAVPKALKQAGLTLDDIDVIELNEAFAAQALAVMRELNMPAEKVNLNGGAVALGHPLGATGARLTVMALHELERLNARYALITMCIGGGMGAAGIIERV